MIGYVRGDPSSKIEPRKGLGDELAARGTRARSRGLKIAQDSNGKTCPKPRYTADRCVGLVAISEFDNYLEPS